VRFEEYSHTYTEDEGWIEDDEGNRVAKVLYSGGFRSLGPWRYSKLASEPDDA
jgi:hypothetical protein